MGMSSGIHFDEDVSNHLFALGRSWGRAMAWARAFGADSRDIAIAEAAYQAALADVGASFGLQRAELVMIFKGQIVYLDQDRIQDKKGKVISERRKQEPGG